MTVGVGVLLMQALAPRVAGGDRLPAKDLLERVLIALSEPVPPFAMHVIWDKTGPVGNVGGVGFRGARVETDECFDGTRYDVTESESRINPAGELVPFMVTRAIWTGQQYLIKWHHGKGSVLHLNVTRENSSSLVMADQPPGGMLRGKLYTQEDPIKSLRDAGTARYSEDQQVAGVLCQVVSGHTPVGQCTVWIDAKRGCVPLKIRVEKRAGDLWFEKPVADRPLPAGVTAAVELELTDIKVGTINGRHMIISATQTYNYIDDHGIPRWLKFTAERSNINLNPDFAALGAFQMTGVPEGHPVHNEDNPNLLYVWKNGQAVLDPRVESEAAEIDRWMERETRPGPTTGQSH